MKTVTLPSGAELRIDLAPFAVSKALYLAVVAEGPKIKLGDNDDVNNAIKDIFCIMLSSKSVADALVPCMQRALYNNIKITDEVFEPAEARQDYFEVCFHVAQENLEPFLKSLYARFSPIMETLRKAQA